MKQSFNPLNQDLIVNVGGQLLPRSDAKVSVFDSLVQGGDGCWEGLRLYQGRIFKLTEHLKRLRHSALAMGFESIPQAAKIRHEIQRTLEANKMTDGVHIRLTLSRGEKITSGMDPRLNQAGPLLIVLAEHKIPVYSKTGLTLITSSLRRFPPDCLDPKIHHNNLLQSILAKMEANAAGADDAIVLDMSGFVAETNAPNIFLVADGEVNTPRTVACPEGVTRATVLELCRAAKIPCLERDISLAEFHRADEVFCTGTMGEIAAVIKIDGRTICQGEVGQLTKQVAELYAQCTSQQGEEILS